MGSKWGVYKGKHDLEGQSTLRRELCSRKGTLRRKLRLKGERHLEERNITSRVRALRGGSQNLEGRCEINASRN